MQGGPDLWCPDRAERQRAEGKAVRTCHTMASLVLHETKDVKLVASRLGHASELLVLKTYGHLLPGVDREAADRPGEVVKRRAQGRAGRMTRRATEWRGWMGIEPTWDGSAPPHGRF